MNFTLGRRLKNLVKIQFFYKEKRTPVVSEIIENDPNDKYDIRRVRYDNGTLKAEIHMKNGKLHGQANLYYESGRIKAREFYRENNLQGLSRWYYESGELQSEKYFDEGKHIYTNEYDKEGHLVKQKKI